MLPAWDAAAAPVVARPCRLLCFGGGPGATPRDALATPQQFARWYAQNRTAAPDTLDLPVERAWELLSKAYQEVGFPATAARNVIERTLATPRLDVQGPIYPRELTSDYIDCGQSPAGARRADTYAVTFVIITQVRAVDEGRSVVETFIDGRARDRVTATNSVSCKGTGKLERQITGHVRRLSRG
jgi:hypothetical protein